jgi:hypothetical protein
MLIILDKNTGKERQRILTDGIKNIDLKENEVAHYFPNSSETAKQIMGAHSYTFNADKTVTVTKTIAQWKAELPTPQPEETDIQKIMKRLDAIEKHLNIGGGK